MKHYTVQELWAFISRADTIERVQIATDFLMKLDYINMDDYCDMMDALASKERDYHHRRAEQEYQDMAHRRGSHLPWNR